MNRVAPLSRPPWHFRLAKHLIRRGWRGPAVLIRGAHRLGLLNHVVRYPLSDSVTVDVPLYRPENWWDADEVRAYEAPLVEALAAAAGAKSGPLRLVDCGAEIGLFSALMVARLPQIAHVTAIEPDPAVLEILESNVGRLPVPGEARLSAVGDTAGRGRLAHPADAPSDHAQFIVSDAKGTTEIIRIDDLNLPRDGTLLLKLDIEGAELAALDGARQTLAEVADFVVTVEAHPHVSARIGVDPIESLRLLESIRPCAFTIAERPEVELSTERGFF